VRPVRALNLTEGDATPVRPPCRPSPPPSSLSGAEVARARGARWRTSAGTPRPRSPTTPARASRGTTTRRCRGTSPTIWHTRPPAARRARPRSGGALRLPRRPRRCHPHHVRTWTTSASRGRRMDRRSAGIRRHWSRGAPAMWASWTPASASPHAPPATRRGGEILPLPLGFAAASRLLYLPVFSLYNARGNPNRTI
jgi:hypothetical protein